MKKLFIVSSFIILNCLTVSAQERQKIRAVNSTDIKIQKAEEKKPAVEELIAQLQNEINQLKAELEKQKTATVVNYKVLDYSIGQLKAKDNEVDTRINDVDSKINLNFSKFEKHVHSMGSYRITGFVSSKLDCCAQNVKVATADSSDNSNTTGKPISQ
ncbi:hypothetical protein [Flavobacterium sp. H122]|uniref:hypothetical protein n=1 Tax=Flavobacterium sp. H122 TaxID=2529860 RepID=UPI0010A9FE7C|nr:hypothetical protein [Flavobacterium sp. H122]